VSGSEQRLCHEDERIVFGLDWELGMTRQTDLLVCPEDMDTLSKIVAEQTSELN
jgi:hypothetical protein